MFAMRRAGRSFWADNGAAIAPLYALALFALIGVGGIAFDYARLVSMDSELQNAADQAALAAATQLDKQVGAQQRAIDAAQGGLVSNSTLFANETGGSRTVTVPTVTFYSSKADAEADTNGFSDPDDADLDAQAGFVRVTVAARTANFALTPVVDAISATIDAEAVAGLGSAICKTPPLMMCNPDEPVGNSDVDYPIDVEAKIGFGIRLVGNGSYAPGNFGFLQTGYGTGANALLQAIGYNTPPGDCIAQTGVTTKTGVNAAVMDGFNTRFDVNANGNSCPGGDVNCSPSINVKKDLVRGNACGITGNGWEENSSNASNFDTRRYKPTSNSVYPTTKTPAIMGHPRDICHAWSDTGNCGGVSGRRMGNGVWDISAYMRANHPSMVSAGVYNTSNNAAILAASGSTLENGRTYPTRYQVYQWEIADYASRLTTHAGSGGKIAYDKPVSGTCLATASAPYGLVPGGETIDRRRISAAVLNCDALNITGHEVDQPVLKWIDLFLVEPSISRTKCTSGSGCNTKYSDKTDLYVELIGETTSGAAGETAGQVVRRDLPYLIQ